jgi:hypothetical protein
LKFWERVVEAETAAKRAMLSGPAVTVIQPHRQQKSIKNL